MPVQCTCRQCGAAFFKRPSDVATGRGKFCSQICYDGVRTPSLTVYCRRCGQPFTTSSAIIKRVRVYCSTTCSWPARACLRCGNSFITKGSSVLRGGGKFCSQTCYRGTLAARFWSRVDQNGPSPGHRPELGPCWIWTGSTTAGGYGKLGAEYRTLLAHRLSWKMARGPIRAGRWVLHACDEPSCVRPTHLFLGLAPDNYADMVAKGRRGSGPARGERNGRAKLTEFDVAEIRTRYAQGETSVAAFAVEFRMTSQQMRMVVQRKSWKHLD